MNKQNKNQFLLYASWLVAIVATLGSLYFSQIREFIPCELCWYQRILMYPLTILLGIATFKNDLNIKIYVLPLTLIGLSISVFHYLEQKVPGFAEIKPCVNGVPCNTQYINWLGFITIPFLAGTAFLLITIMMVLIKRNSSEKNK